MTTSLFNELSIPLENSSTYTIEKLDDIISMTSNEDFQTIIQMDTTFYKNYFEPPNRLLDLKDNILTICRNFDVNQLIDLKLQIKTILDEFLTLNCQFAKYFFDYRSDFIQVFNQTQAKFENELKNHNIMISLQSDSIKYNQKLQITKFHLSLILTEVFQNSINDVKRCDYKSKKCTIETQNNQLYFYIIYEQDKPFNNKGHESDTGLKRIKKIISLFKGHYKDDRKSKNYQIEISIPL